MYQPQGNGVKQEPQTIEGSDFKVMDTDPLKPRIESREDGIYWVSPRADSQRMGADPAWLTLALTLPDVNEAWLESFSDSLFDLLNYYDMQLIGGDTTRG